MKIFLGLTGASGSLYFCRLLEVLTKQGNEIHLAASENGKKVFEHEMGFKFDDYLESIRGNLKAWPNDDLFSDPASGSFRLDGMVIVPCSTATLGTLAAGSGKTLIERTADVMLKERRKLILVPRETPFSLIHLRSMTNLTEAGAVILPASPGFYHKPSSIQELIDFIAARVLDQLGLAQIILPPWSNPHD